MRREIVLEILTKYKNSSARKYNIDALGLFGSVARDEASSNSDVDIVIKTSNPDMFAMVHIKDELQELLSKNIDIVRLREKMNPFLKNRIEKDVIYV
ncbi:MAG: nucleotidyltransferase [Helicobacteraceae bacterium]|nr:nucleotidyltransferase [Helicobacteraceae bacterium]